MFVKNLYLKNFRNYCEEEYTFNEGFNILKGNNAQGKTNAAEAVFLLATGYSPRVKKDKQVIRYGETKAIIKAEAISKVGKVEVEIDYYQNGKKILINGVETRKIGEILGNIFGVFFNPGELKLIQDSPEDRRRFLDISISQINKRYFYSLAKYKKILAQRNNLLKDSNRDMILDTLPIWDEQLSLYAGEIIYARNNYIKMLEPYAKESHAYITNGLEDLSVVGSIKYEGSVGEIAEQVKQALQNSVEKDLLVGFTTVGPHRDDLKISIGEEDVRVFGSQGQQRTAALSLKLAELKIYKEHFGEYPILILDDALSELDISRQRRLLDRIKDVQTIITCTHIEDKVIEGFKYQAFNVEGGKIVR